MALLVDDITKTQEAPVIDYYEEEEDPSPTLTDRQQLNGLELVLVDAACIAKEYGLIDQIEYAMIMQAIPKNPSKDIINPLPEPLTEKLERKLAGWVPIRFKVSPQLIKDDETRALASEKLRTLGSFLMIRIKPHYAEA